MTAGRPAFDWTEDVEDEIFSRLIGGESIVDICGPNREDFLPGQRAFYSRLADDKEFSQRYARAREAQAHQEADEIKAIADAATPEDVGVARLRMDARKWRASKLAPKKYGDSQNLTLKGDEESPIVHKVVREIVRPKHSNG